MYVVRSLIAPLYLIEILHQTTTFLPFRQISHCCILSKFYIKPQRLVAVVFDNAGCILSKFYIKPQQLKPWERSTPGCILSKFYIKPQPPAEAGYLFGVVSYRNSTSNHNHGVDRLDGHKVVSYRNSTSNHNTNSPKTSNALLYLIEILHQTTTKRSKTFCCTRCILSKFYIKPQLQMLCR